MTQFNPIPGNAERPALVPPEGRNGFKAEEPQKYKRSGHNQEDVGIAPPHVGFKYTYGFIDGISVGPISTHLAVFSSLWSMVRYFIR